ncbi:MAG: DNA-binding transcriptional LysR family regulator [Halioglobus sp.]
MDTKQLAKIDLNLLISLQILLEERSVSRAAERLYITQPAMSKTLSRLRHVFGDPLFIRGSHGMQPTPRAQELSLNLGDILTNINHLVAPATFDPADFNGEITLALSEYIGVALLPPLIQKLHSIAPRLTIKTLTRVENQMEQLSKGTLDFAIQIEQAFYSSDFRTVRVASNPPAILVRDTHPLTKSKITWERLASYPVIRLYISDLEQIEIVRTSDTFNRVRNPNQSCLETSHLLTSLEVLRTTDYFMPGPASILQNTTVAEHIVALPLPVGGEYTMDYALVSHRRTEGSAAHQWFWEQILDTLATLRIDADQFNQAKDSKH